MKVACIACCAFFLILTGCQPPVHPATPVPSGLAAVINGTGSPRLVTEFEMGKVTQQLEAKYKELDPGAVIVRGERVVLGGNITVGATLVVESVASSANARKAEQIKLLYLSRDEVVSLAAALRDMKAYLDGHPPVPANGQQFLQWNGQSGASAIAGFSGEPAVYLRASEDVSVSLTPSQAAEVAQKLDSALVEASR